MPKPTPLDSKVPNTAETVQPYIHSIRDLLFNECTGEEVLLLNVRAEVSDFCRFNQNKALQQGWLNEHQLSMRLIVGQRHMEYSLTLSMTFDLDKTRVLAALKTLRHSIIDVPEDPFLLYARSGNSSERIAEDCLPPAREILQQVFEAHTGLDSVGILAHGRQIDGFASSLGQNHWYERSSYNLDWAVYASGDKAIKSRLSANRWDFDALMARTEHIRSELRLLHQPKHTIKPGSYRAFLAPMAVHDLWQQVNVWGGFSHKAIDTKASALQHLVEGKDQLAEQIQLKNDHKQGLSPSFDEMGFSEPETVDLIANGKFKTSLVTPAHAKEFGLSPNSADVSAPSLSLSPGTLAEQDILGSLGTGVYLSNLWYLNFSDKAAARITGMSRYACYWVEDGHIVAPLSVMRFDDTIYRMFGSQLIDLTESTSSLINPATYDQRSSDSARMPGALLESLQLTN